MKEYRPNIVLTHFPYDSNTDHGIVHKSVVIATRSLPNCEISGVLLFEIPSSTTYARLNNTFRPDTYIKLSKDSLDKKIKAMEAYVTERAEYPHPRSRGALKALAMLRGTEIGYNYAEAFQTLWRKGL
jgi:LmbE family N-acetylglucosaminyl deacetylase